MVKDRFLGLGFMDRVVIRVMIRVSVRVGENGHFYFYIHFDDPQTVMQTQTVDNRVIN